MKDYIDTIEKTKKEDKVKRRLKKDMSSKLKTTTIPFLGKDRHFKRCKQSEVLEASKPLGYLQRDIEKEQEVIQDEIEIIETLKMEADALEEEADLLKLQPDLTKEDIKQIVDLRTQSRKKFTKASKKLKEVRVKKDQLMDMILEKDKEGRIIGSEIAEALIEGVTKEYFLENADLVDIDMAINLPLFYKMVIGNFSQAKINEEYNKMLESSIKTSMEHLFQNTE